MRQGNLGYLTGICIHFAGMTYARNVPVLDNYTPLIKSYIEHIQGYDKADLDELLAGMKDTLIILLNHPQDFALNDWFCDAALHAMESDEQVHALLARIWDQFFPHERWDLSGYEDEPYTMSDEEVY